MRMLIVLILAVLLALGGLAVARQATAETPTATAADEARRLMKTFATTLKGELVAAIQAGGPPHAVKVCEEVAPGIAASLSAESGWEVGRTSSKTRNPANAPDPWEQQVLAQFEARRAAGVPVDELRHAEVVERDGEKTYRYMQAIPTDAVCLTCHGKALAPDLVEALDRAYPEDRARGYEVGDIRGAFTLSKPL